GLTVKTPSKEEHPTYPFYFDLSVAGLFEFNETIDEKLLQQFAKINCPAIIFPYLREALADLTRRSGFPALHLPVTNFVEMEKQAQSNQGDPDSGPPKPPAKRSKSPSRPKKKKSSADKP
ncbi:MAG: protein-export chaperone SecB, partial [Deltaproteobacteria bacterium]|nr:protein-export chaperone SecB [Deltaproteobacteria bacterium]